MDGRNFRSQYGFGINVVKPLCSARWLNVYADWNDITFARQHALDVYADLIGAGLTQQLSPTFLVAGKAYRGWEKPHQRILYRFNGRHYVGFDLRADWEWLPGLRPFASGAFQRSNYCHRHAVFGAVRRDRMFDTALGLNKQLDKNLDLTAELHHTQNASTLKLYRYRRHYAQVVLNYHLS